MDTGTLVLAISIPVGAVVLIVICFLIYRHHQSVLAKQVQGEALARAKEQHLKARIGKWTGPVPPSPEDKKAAAARKAHPATITMTAPASPNARKVRNGRVGAYTSRTPSPAPSRGSTTPASAEGKDLSLKKSKNIMIMANRQRSMSVHTWRGNVLMRAVGSDASTPGMPVHIELEAVASTELPATALLMSGHLAQPHVAAHMTATTKVAGTNTSHAPIS